MTFLRLVLLPFATMWTVVFLFEGNFRDLFLGLFFINWTFGILVFLFAKYYTKKLFLRTVKT